MTSDRLPQGVVRGADRAARCWWSVRSADYVRYHDEEWGRPVVDDRRLFEKLVLEGFQSGLSWLTILRKRDNFRRAFAGFDLEAVAAFTRHDVARLLGDAGIVRHRGKIEAAISNAQRACELVTETGSLAAYFWRFEPPARARPRRLTRRVLLGLGQSAESAALSRDLKRRGFRFVGPTTVYAFMQAMGLVNDHLDGCSVREAVERQRRALARPGQPARR